MQITVEIAGDVMSFGRQKHIFSSTSSVRIRTGWYLETQTEEHVTLVFPVPDLEGLQNSVAAHLELHDSVLSSLILAVWLCILVGMLVGRTSG